MNWSGQGGRTIIVSVGCGCAFAVSAAMGFPLAFLVLPFVLAFGALVGLALLPATVFALADRECRPSFAWICLPTCLATFVGSLVAGPMVAALVTVVVYAGSAGGAGAVAMHRRRRLRWHGAGLCPCCGYDVRGLETARCPECGRDTSIRPRWRTSVEIMRP